MKRAKSIGFFMSKGDETSFCKLVLSRPQTSLIRYAWYKEPVYEEYTSVDDFLSQQVRDDFNSLPGWLIWCKDLGPIDLKYIEIYPDRKRYLFDHTENHVLYFGRSETTEYGISEGELVVNPVVIADDCEIYSPNIELLKFFNKLARWIRKNGIRASFDGLKPSSNLYILPEALAVYESGFKLIRAEDGLIIKNHFYMPFYEEK